MAVGPRGPFRSLNQRSAPILVRRSALESPAVTGDMDHSKFAIKMFTEAKLMEATANFCTMVQIVAWKLDPANI